MPKTKVKKTAAQAHPVTVRVLPVVNCAECTAPLPYEPGPGHAAAVLTTHYNDKHLDLATPPAATG